MKWLNSQRMRLVLIGFMAAIVLGGKSVKADFTFGIPTLFDETVNSPGIEYFDCISSDGLEIYIDKPVGGGITASNWDIYVSTRETTNDPWPIPTNLGPTVNSSGVIDSYACLSSDGLELYFSSRRSGGYGQQDIWVTTRDSKDTEWGTPVNLGSTINTSSYDWLPWITPDGLELYFSSDRPGGYGGNDIWVARRTATNDPWGEPMNIGPLVNSTAGEFHPCLAPDGLVLFFSDFDNTNFGFHPGGYGLSDMWMSRRKSTADPWEPPVNLGYGMNTNAWDSVPRVSPDGSVLYFTSSRPESRVMTEKSDIWQAAIIPIVDFNGDGIIDAADMCIMVDHWGEDYSLCDIGPMPWGDGVVDVQDLIVLSKHLFEDYRLVAHWDLDEGAGNNAYDSADQYDATLQGGPIWQPEGGKVGGALQFDGIDDYISTPFIMDPSKGSFSVFAWINCRTPGQVILSQADTTGPRGNIPGSTWLGIDPSGKLMTGFGDTYFGTLVSESVITDFQWHHVGFVYDMDTLHRKLYVDGVQVAEDTMAVAGDPSGGGMYIGASKDLDAGAFFSGTIDDVRIYNQTLSAEQIAALAQ